MRTIKTQIMGEKKMVDKWLQERWKEKEPIPNCCKEDCIFRDSRAKYMPACQYRGKLIIKDEICQIYRGKKEEFHEPTTK